MRSLLPARKTENGKVVNARPTTGVLQGACACRAGKSGGGECPDCRRKRTTGASAASSSSYDFSRVRVQANRNRNQPSYLDDLRIDGQLAPAQVPGAGVAAAASVAGAAAGPVGAIAALIPGPVLHAVRCAVICDQAYRDASLNGGGGGVICDGATKCPCVFDVPPATRGECSALDTDVMRHEAKHLGDVDCDPSKGLHRPPFRDQAQATGIECTHRRASITELDTAIAAASEPCKTKMTTIRGRLQTWVTANCGA